MSKKKLLAQEDRVSVYISENRRLTILKGHRDTIIIDTISFRRFVGLLQTNQEFRSNFNSPVFKDRLTLSNNNSVFSVGGVKVYKGNKTGYINLVDKYNKNIVVSLDLLDSLMTVL